MITRAEPAPVAAARLAQHRRLPLERLIPFLLFVCTALYLLAFRRVTNMDPDEGIVLQGAERILHGQIPYRDFFSFYTPGSFYLTALMMKVFGDSFAVARTLVVFIGAIFPVISYVLARRTCSRQISFFIAILVAITSAPYRFMVLHNWDSTFWACLAVYSAVRWLESSGAPAAFATGGFTSLSFLSEQSKGAGLCLGIAAAILIFSASGRRLHKLAYLICGFLFPICITVAYFASQHALRPMFQDLLWPLQHYSMANHVRYGDQNWPDRSRAILFHSGSALGRTIKVIGISPGFVVPVLPLISAALLVYWSLRLRRSTESNAGHYTLMCALLSGLLVSVLVVRPDIIHFMYLTPLFYLVLAWILEAKIFSSRVLASIRVPIAAYIMIALGLMGASFFFSVAGAKNRIETRRGTVFSREPDSVIPHTLAATAPGDKILVYPYLPIYYYLTATQSASKYEYFQPGMSTPEQAQEIISSLQISDVRTVLFVPGFASEIPNSWPGTPVSAIAHDPIADHIARNFRMCSVIRSAAGWNFLFMRRRDSSCQ